MPASPTRWTRPSRARSSLPSPPPGGRAAPPVPQDAFLAGLSASCHSCWSPWTRTRISLCPSLWWEHAPLFRQKNLFVSLVFLAIFLLLGILSYWAPLQGITLLCPSLWWEHAPLFRQKKLFVSLVFRQKKFFYQVFQVFYVPETHIMYFIRRC